MHIIHVWTAVSSHFLPGRFHVWSPSPRWTGWTWGIWKSESVAFQVTRAGPMIGSNIQTLILYRILAYIYIYIEYPNIWGLFKMMVPQNCPYAALSRPFRALSRPSRIGTRNYDHVFVCKFCINGIQTFRQPFAALSPLQQKHVHICRFHSDTKSLAWVLEPLSYCIYSNLYSI